MFKPFSKVRFFFFFVVCLPIIHSCNDRDQWVPYVPVNRFLYLNDPDVSQKLSTIGGVFVLPGEGYAGIMVYRESENLFRAFDMACTYEISSDCAVAETAMTGIVACLCCGSEFYIILEGMVKEGPAGRALKQYEVSFDGEKIHIYN